MDYFPITLNLANKPTTVVGGGSVAERRVESLLEMRCGNHGDQSDRLRPFRDSGQ